MAVNKGGGGDDRTRRLLSVIVLLLVLLLVCGTCTLLSVSPLGDAFWRGVMSGMGR